MYLAIVKANTPSSSWRLSGTGHYEFSRVPQDNYLDDEYWQSLMLYNEALTSPWGVGKLSFATWFEGIPEKDVEVIDMADSLIVKVPRGVWAEWDNEKLRYDFNFEFDKHHDFRLRKLSRLSEDGGHTVEITDFSADMNSYSIVSKSETLTERCFVKMNISSPDESLFDAKTYDIVFAKPLPASRNFYLLPAIVGCILIALGVCIRARSNRN